MFNIKPKDVVSSVVHQIVLAFYLLGMGQDCTPVPSLKFDVPMRLTLAKEM